MINRSWHMYPLGILFGLGFDTATEIGLLGISATEASKGLSLWSVLVFPALFAAGMSLIDTTDNILMLGRLRLGLRKAHPQALLQHHHHNSLRCRRLRRWRNRGAWPACRPVPPQGSILEPDQQVQR